MNEWMKKNLKLENCSTDWFVSKKERKKKKRCRFISLICTTQAHHMPTGLLINVYVVYKQRNLYYITAKRWLIIHYHLDVVFNWISSICVRFELRIYYLLFVSIGWPPFELNLNNQQSADVRVCNVCVARSSSPVSYRPQYLIVRAVRKMCEWSCVFGARYIESYGAPAYNNSKMTLELRDDFLFSIFYCFWLDDDHTNCIISQFGIAIAEQVRLPYMHVWCEVWMWCT